MLSIPAYADFGGDGDRLSLQLSRNQCIRKSLSIQGCCIYPVDSRFYSGLNGCDGISFYHVIAPILATHRPAPQSDTTPFQVSADERAVFQIGSPVFRARLSYYKTVS